MTKQVQLRRGTSSEHTVFTGAVGEVTVDTTLDVLVVHDGVKLGGHYLVGTGFGATVSQGLVNKSFIGIGTTTTGSLALIAIGDVAIAGNLNLRSLAVAYEPPIVRQGELTDSNIGDPNELLFITGISTDNIRVGQIVQNPNHIDLDCVVDAVGISSIQLSIIHFGVNGSISTSFTFINPESGKTSLYDLEVSNHTIIAEAGITSAYIDNLFISSGIVTTTGITSAYINDAYVNVGIVTNLFVSTQYVDLANINGGIATSFNITNAYVASGIITNLYTTTLSANTGYINSGIITTAGITSARVDNFFATSGIVTTAGISVGYIDNLYLASGIVTTVGITSARVDNFFATSGIVTTAGITSARVDNFFALSGIVTTLNVQTSNLSDANINSGIITTAGITSARVDNFFATSGIVTTAGISSARVDNLFATSGIVTSLVVTQENVDLLSINNLFFAQSGIVTTAGITSARVDNFFATSGIVTTAGITSARVDNFFATSGIVTTAGISSARVDDFFATSGIVTTAGISVGYIDNLYLASGIVTTAAINTLSVTSGIVTNLSVSNATVISAIASTVGITSARVDNFFATSGIVTTAGISSARVDDFFATSGIVTTAGISSARVDNLYVASGIVTTVGITTAGISSARVDDFFATSGIVTTAGISFGYIDNLYVTSGIVTTAGISSARVDDFFATSGIVTTAGISSARLDVAYISSGIATDLNIETSNTNLSRVNSGFATYFDVTGVGTVQTLNSQVGVITYLTVSEINVNGFVTFGNISIGAAGTDFVVDGDARITGILSVGTGTVTIVGPDSSIIGLQSLRSSAGFVTSLSGTNINYSGVSTFNNVGVSTLSLVGFNTLGNQDKTVKIQLSNSGISSNYTLTLPPRIGSAGQLLGLLPDGTLGFTTNGAGLFESRYYVSAANGNDAFDGKALPVKTIRRAAQLASFDSFQIPGQRFLDAGDLLEANNNFIKEEAIAYVKFNFENIGIATIFPDFNENTWKAGIGSVVEALTYDIRFGGNSKSRNIGSVLKDSGTYTGEEVPLIFAIDYVKFIGQYVINNQSPPTLYQTSVNQTFDFTIKPDPENSNANYFHTSKDARNLIVGNRQEIIDKSLASVAVGVGSTFFFPGDAETTTRSRYYYAHKLIEINKQEIVDKSIASLAVGFPTGFYVPGPGVVATTKDSRYYRAYQLIQINKSEIVSTALTAINTQYPNLWSSGISSAKCQRDLGYFVDAVSTDVFTGGNNYARTFAAFYFDNVGTAISTGLVGEEQQSIYGFQQAGIQMRRAITNQLSNKNLNATPGPTVFAGGGGNVGISSTAACTDVQNNITSLVGVVTAVVGAGNTSGLPTLNLGNFNLSVIGFGTTAGIWKCARDTAFFVDAVKTDVFTGGNNYSRRFAGFYFNNVGQPTSNGLLGEEAQSNYVFTTARDLMRLAVTNQLNTRDLTITADPYLTITATTGTVSTTKTSTGGTTGQGYVSIANNTGLVLGMPVFGTGIGSGAYITGLGATFANLSHPNTANTNGETITFGAAATLTFDAQATAPFQVNQVISVTGVTPAGYNGNYVVTNCTTTTVTYANSTTGSLSVAGKVGSNLSPESCANVRSTITSLAGIVTTVVAAGSTAGIGTTTNYGYFLVNSTYNVRNLSGISTLGIGISSVGVGSTTVVGGRKCARDLGYIIDAIAQDVSFGTNQHTLYATKKYFDGAGTLISNGVLGEEAASVYAFQSLGKYAKQAVTNWLNYQDLTIIGDVSIGGTNKNPNVCATTRATIDSLVGILTTALISGSLVGIASTNIGITDCANVRTALVNYAGIVTTIVGFGTNAAPALSLPQTKSTPVCIIVEAGDYSEDNPIILYDDVAIVGDNLRNTIIRPLNAGKDLFRVRNGIYVTGFAMKDAVDAAGIPQFTFDYACAYDDPTDPFTSRIGYATKTDKPTITRSPYIQNCSILSFLGGNGILVDGSKVLSPNVPVISQEVELPVDGEQPEQGKSMVAAAFTMVSFGGIGWRTINDGYAQVVSCFQIFCKYGSLTQSGGYLSITNSATNFGLFALRSTGFSPNSFKFDRGRIAATGTSGGLTTLKVVGLGRSEQDLYVVRFFDPAGNDATSNFKSAPVVTEFIGAATTQGGIVNVIDNTFNIISHPFLNADSVVYLGDEGVNPSRVIGGLVNQNQYYVKYINASSFQLTEDDSLTRIVDLTSASTGIHTFQKNTQEFFVKEVIDRHNVYQRLTIPGTQTVNFVSGKSVSQTVAGGTAVGYALTFQSSTRYLYVSVELSEGVRRNFAATGGSNLTINDHSGTPISTSISAVIGISTYWSIQFKVDSTLPGGTIQGVQNLPETYRLNFHRPSIINSSGHTWEYSGSGIDYNALPQNGGKTDIKTEQVSERGGRVYSSGTNELGDFKIGDFITAFNRTGNIIFNNTVTIGTLDSIRLSLSGGTAIEEFSIDTGMGDNETGGPLNKRVSTQLAVRSFLNNRLGNFIDKLVSTNAIPNAVVQLNSIGQINPDLIPPKTVNYFRANNVGGRTQLVNLIPATNLLQGDVVSEPVDSFVLVSDLIGQFIILNNSSTYNFLNGDVVVSTTSAGGAVGIVTTPPKIGVPAGSSLSFANVGYGTTGLVRGVPLTLKTLVGGSGYNVAGIYTGIRLDTSSGIGTGLTATVTVSAAGTVSNVAINTGGFKFATNDVLTLNDPAPIGGRTGGSNFTVQVNTVETRLYLKLTNQQKFPGSSNLPDFISDRNATGVSTNIGIGTTFSFTPTSIDVGGSLDFTNDRIVIGAGHTLQDGDPVIYRVSGGTAVSPLISGEVYYAKRVGVTSIALYTTYALTTIKDLESSGTGSHTVTRPGIVTSSNQIIFKNHGFATGDPVRITGNTPTGVTTGNFYFVGSVTQNSLTLHETRAESLTSINGLLLNTINLSAATNPVGIMTFTKQNITYTATVNTSSNDENNFSLLSTNSLDAANIISGILSPTRLGTGAANNETFLRGDSSYRKVVTAIGIGSTQPFDVQGYTSADFPAGGVGFTTYYGIVRLGLNRVASTIDAFSTLGVSKFKNSTFSIGADGAVSIKNAASGGDIDAVTLGGNNSSYHLDVNNHTGTIPVTRGGTSLTAAPSNGALLIGNGSSYTLTTTPILQGLLTTQSIAIGANHDISFTTGSWTGEKAGKIQFHSSNLYLQFTTQLIGRNASGTNVFTLTNSGGLTITGALSATRYTSTVATGTAPFTVASTTEVANLNAALLNGFASSTSNTANAIVRRDGSGSFGTGRIELSSAGSTTVAQLTFSGSTNNWITFGTNGVAAPTFNTRSVGTKVVYYTNLSASSADYAAGIEGSTLWHSVPTTSELFRWYGGTTVAATLTGAGVFTATGTVSGTRLISTIGTGTAPLTVTSTTEVANLNAALLNGFSSSSDNTGNTIVRRDASGNFNAGTIRGTTIVGGTGSAIGGGGLVVNGTTDNNDSQLIIKKPAQSSFSVLSWDGIVFLTANVYYVNGAWVHDAPSGNNNNQLFVLRPGLGARWYASNNGTGSWNVAADLQLWNDSGVWQRPLANTLTLNTAGTGLSGSTTYNNSGAATFTVTSNATSANTASTIVARDGSGNFSAGTISANLNGRANSLTSFDTRSTNPNPDTFGMEVRFDFKQNTTNGLSDGGTYNGVMSWRKYGTGTDYSGGPMIQLAYTANGNLWKRLSTGNTTWGTWYRFVDTNNASSLVVTSLATSGTGISVNTSVGAVTITSNATSANTGSTIVARDGSGNFSAGTITATLNGTATNTNSISNALGNSHTWTGINYFQSNLGGTSGSLSNPPLQAFCTGGNSAFMSFHRGGAFAVNMGLDSDNVLRIGGWSASANRLQLDMSGNLTLAGQVTANSDIKLKENIFTIENALDKVLNLRGVEFDRIDSGEHHMGVIAQEVEEVIPFLVREDNTGTKSVAYSNMVGLLIEAIKEQQVQINELRDEIKTLKGE